jgi:hypothetical protein
MRERDQEIEKLNQKKEERKGSKVHKQEERGEE